MKTWPLSSLALLATLGVLSLASCADSNDDEPSVDAGANALPEAAAPDGDAGCTGDAGDASDCNVIPTPSCDDFDFCPVSTGPDPRWALTAVWGTAKNDVWAVGSQGTILHWDGASWTPTVSGTKQAIFAIGGSANDLWAVSSRAVVLHSPGITGGSPAWTAMPAVAPTWAPYPPQVWNESLLLSLWSGAGNELWIGSEPYPVLLEGQSQPTQMNLWRRTEAKGRVEWAPSVVATGVAIRGLWGGSTTDVWAVGGVSTTSTKRAGRALHTAASLDGKPIWTEFDTQSAYDLNAVWGTSPSDVWAVGNSGVIRHWNDTSPKRWEIVESPTSVDLRGVWGTGANDVWAVGDEGTILHFDGKAWSPATSLFPSGLQPNLRGVWGSGPTDVWVVGDNIALHYEGKVGAP